MALLKAQKPGREPGEDKRRLRDLAGVGPAVEADFRMLKVHSVSELAACDGDQLYKRLCEITATRQDLCVLDSFRCAIAQARNSDLPAEQRNWWWWSRQRKRGHL